MKAITLWPEWAHAIAHLGKDIENRMWEPWGTMRRGDADHVSCPGCSAPTGGQP